MIFAKAFSAVMTMFCIGILGYLLKRKGWITDETARVMPKFLTTIVLPPFLMRSITATFERDQLLELISGSVVPFISIILCFILAVFVARVFGLQKGRLGIFKVSFAMSNTMNIGLPINIALFGEMAVPYVLLYFFANVTMFWTVGNYCIAHDGNGAHVRMFSLESLKKVFSPPLLGFMTGLALVMLDIHLPVFIDKACKYVGDMAIGLGILYIGVMLQDVRFSDYKLERDVILVLVGRFIISPLAILVLSCFLPLPAIMRKVFVIQASLPVMMNAVILAGYYKADAKYAAVLISVSTLMAIGTVPLFTILLEYFIS